MLQQTVQPMYCRGRCSCSCAILFRHVVTVVGLMGRSCEPHASPPQRGDRSLGGWKRRRECLAQHMLRSANWEAMMDQVSSWSASVTEVQQWSCRHA